MEVKYKDTKVLGCSNMECRIHLDVDCTYVEREDVTRAEGELRQIVEFLKADSRQLQPSQAEDSVDDDVLNAFCWMYRDAK